MKFKLNFFYLSFCGLYPVCHFGYRNVAASFVEDFRIFRNILHSLLQGECWLMALLSAPLALVLSSVWALDQMQGEAYFPLMCLLSEENGE